MLRSFAISAAWMCALLGGCAQERPTSRASDGPAPAPVARDMSPSDMGSTQHRDESLVVVGKNISERGLSFYHTAAVPYRRVIADFETPDGSRLALLVDLTWCRFARQGWYENGGRFLQVVDVGDDRENVAPPQNVN